MSRRFTVAMILAASVLLVGGCDFLKKEVADAPSDGAAYSASATMPISRIITEDGEGSIDLNWLDQQLRGGLPVNVSLVDVRTAEEFNGGHAYNAINIPVALFYNDDGCERVISAIPKDGFVVFHCEFGPRAKDMYYNLKDPVEDGGCGYGEMNRLYYIDATLDFSTGQLRLPR